jgi:hypothetical protein
VTASSAVVPNLDADKVDGYEASGLARLDSANTFTHASTPILIGASGAQGTVRSDLAGYLALQGGTTGLALINNANSATLATMLDAGTFTLYNRMALIGVISPADLSGSDQNDWNPTGISTASVIRITNSSAPTPPAFVDCSITGIAAQTAGAVLVLVVVGPEGVILEAEHASSSAANRFGINADIALYDGDSCVLWYDGTSARWRVIGHYSRAVSA